MNTLKDFIANIESIPIDLYKDKNTKTLLKSVEKINTEFIQAVNRLDDAVFNNHRYVSVDRTKVIDDCNLFFSDLTTVIKSYLKGTPPNAHKTLNELLNFDKNPNEWLLNLSILRYKSVLYRMRGNDEYYMHDKGNMFHIPFDKRGLVTNQRYSIPGFPCLYLGTSLYVCWEELNRPNLETINCVAFRNITSLKFLTIDIPKWFEIKSIDSFKKIIIYLVCTIVVKDKKASFKNEYIIPQLIMQCLVSNNEVNPNDQIDGIKYISTRYYDEKNMVYEKIRPKMINYVIPIRESEEISEDPYKGYSEYLIKRFEQTKTISPYYQQLKKYRFNIQPYINQYDTSVFRKQELALDKMNFEKSGVK